jgi:hypothetical protein
MKLQIAARNPVTLTQTSEDFIAKPRALVYKLPGFFYSSYALSASAIRSAVLVTIEDYIKMAKAGAKAVKYDFDGEVPYLCAYVKLGTSVNGTSKQDALNSIKNYLDPDYSS